jgi:predicted dehydrogenase
MPKPFRIAVIGAGAIAQTSHLPAFAKAPEAVLQAVVDADVERASAAALRWHAPMFSARIDDVLDSIDGAILCVPNHLHEPLAVRLLEKGKAVLCEKPLARNPGEAHRMAEAAQKYGALLMPAYIMRQSATLNWVRKNTPWKKSGLIRVRAFYGLSWNWDFSSRYAFDRVQAGGGALIDLGSHLLDALFWTLDAERAECAVYSDDGESGLEAEGEGELRLNIPGNIKTVPCRFGVSRLRTLANRIEYDMPEGTWIVPVNGKRVFWRLTDGGTRNVSVPKVANLFAAQLRAFVSAARENPPRQQDGKMLLLPETIAALYAMRRPLSLFWKDYSPCP